MDERSILKWCPICDTDISFADDGDVKDCAGCGAPWRYEADGEFVDGGWRECGTLAVARPQDMNSDVIERALKAGDEKTAKTTLEELRAAKKNAERLTRYAGELHLLFWNEVLRAEEIFCRYRGSAPELSQVAPPAPAAESAPIGGGSSSPDEP